jgi:hypothetical protein
MIWYNNTGISNLYHMGGRKSMDSVLEKAAGFKLGK